MATPRNDAVATNIRNSRSFLAGKTCKTWQILYFGFYVKNRFEKNCNFKHENEKK